MTEPVVGNPEQMAAAIAKAFDLINQWRVSDRATPFRDMSEDQLLDKYYMAYDTLEEVEEALEDYQEN